MQPMLSYAAGVDEPPLLDETIGDNLVRTVDRFEDRDALIECATGRRWTYAELHEATQRIATALLQRGIRPGDRVGIWSPNTAEWTMIQYATAQIGAILVTINPAYRTEELEYALNQSSVAMVLSAASFKTSDYAEMLDAVSGRCPQLREVVIVGSAQWRAIVETEVDAGALREARTGLRPSDPINIQYTSGTTGFPKGATLTHTNILNNGYLVGEGLGYTEVDRVCIPVPFYHCF
ncbi:MAG: AMP-binding protein, partial [Mycobacterium sp.]|nr:AMP-binding protein [Mycobacterium sp.]